MLGCSGLLIPPRTTFSGKLMHRLRHLQRELHFEPRGDVHTMLCQQPRDCSHGLFRYDLRIGRSLSHILPSVGGGGGRSAYIAPLDTQHTAPVRQDYYRCVADLDASEYGGSSLQAHVSIMQLL